MFLTLAKLESRIKELASYRYREITKLKEFYMTDDDGEIGNYPPTLDKYHAVMKVGDRWEGRDRYIWLSKNVSLPEKWKGRKVIGLFNFGKTGSGNNSGFESLLFLNGRPFQGVDSNHQEVFFPEDIVGQHVQVDFRLWSGLEGGGKPKTQTLVLETANLAWLDEELDYLYHTSLAAWQTICELPDEMYEKHQVIVALNRAFSQIDWSNPGSEEYYQSCTSASLTLVEHLEGFEKRNPVTVHCIGHTHIDVAWLWRIKHSREKVARSFSTVLRLMEQYPEYIFLQSQPQLYEYLKEDYPEIYKEVQQRIKEGRWEIEGGMWLEADCNIPSGESLVRQLLYGKRFMKEEFGVDSTYLWLPDVFGYSWALPQILTKSGIKTFMTTKISWNQYNRMPHDTFTWRGMDGSEILTHFITTPEPSKPENSWFYTYNGVITASTVTGSWQGYRDKNSNQDLLLSFGYGDGGGGVNREMLELRRGLDKMPGIPHVKTTRAGDYFAKLHEGIDNTTEYVHTWDGELYLEYHRGTYTSQAYNKRMNRKLELAYREIEWLSTWSAVENGWESYSAREINQGWKIILRNQFHDIIPGSSIKEVYEDSKEEYEVAQRIAQRVLENTQQILVKDDEKFYTVFNASQWTDGQVVFIPFDRNNQDDGYWLDSVGQILISQRTGTGWIVQLKSLPSFGGTVIQFLNRGRGLEHSTDMDSNPPELKGLPSVSPFHFSTNGVETPFYLIEWTETRQLKRIYDKTNKREVLSSNSNGNILQVFEDKPVQWDAWDIDIFYQEKMEEVTEVIESSVVEDGPIRAVIRTVWKYRNSKITQDMILYSQNGRIDFPTAVDWNEKQKLVKVAFPVDIRSTEATYDIQYGNVKRPTHWNTSWDMARFETVGHQWADLSETGYGVSLLNDCKYGYDIKGNVIRLSLLKSAIYPDPSADQGLHHFTYSLLPHQGDWRTGETVQQAWYINHPPHATEGKLQTKDSFMIFENQHVQIDAIKKKEDENAVIIRFHEFEGRRGKVIVDFPLLEVKQWMETNLMEECESEQYQAPIHLDIKPYEIKTIAVYF